tara:strand:+ start:1104 stop:1742 length:639 start_codon:yes stop_codon:yes gene_type:complete
MKKILITQRIDFINNYSEVRESLDRELPSLVFQLGYLPIPLTNMFIDSKSCQSTNLSDHSGLAEFLNKINPDGLVLSGGNDIGQYQVRDITEQLLLEWAENKNIPVLGICRGMQLMAVRSGCKLVRVEGHVKAYNKLISIKKGEKFPQEIKCFHNWGIKNCPKDFSVLARTHDGFVEAFKHSSLRWEGWMWHPERDKPFNDINKNRIENLFG